MRVRRAAVGLAALAGLVACHRHDHIPRVEVRTLTVDPLPGALDVSRRPLIRAQFDRDLDPTSCNAGSCRLEGPNGAVVVAVGYDAGSRTVTLVPQASLGRLAVHRVALTTALRTAAGEGFASTHAWSFTTADVAAWEPGAKLGDGQLRRLARGQDGAVHAVWSAPDGQSLIAHDDGAGWSAPRSLDVPNAIEAAVAAEATGRIVVAALAENRDLWLITGSRDGFAAPVFVATEAADVDVAASSSGHVALAWWRRGPAGENLGGRVRVFVPGAGFAAEHPLNPTVPRVWLGPTGEGLAVCAFFQVVGSFPQNVSAVVSCVRFCLDPLGGLALCDPPATGNGPLASRVRFQPDGSILTTQLVRFSTGPELVTSTQVFSAAGAGWRQEVPMFASIGHPYSTDLATGANGEALFLVAGEVSGRGVGVHWRADQVSAWTASHLEDGAQIATFGPACAAVVTAAGVGAALWTAPSPGSADLAVIAVANRRPAGGWEEPLVLDPSPFARQLAPSCGLAAVAGPGDSAFAAWTNGGEVRYSRLR